MSNPRPRNNVRKIFFISVKMHKKQTIATEIRDIDKRIRQLQRRRQQLASIADQFNSFEYEIELIVDNITKYPDKAYVEAGLRAIDASLKNIWLLDKESRPYDELSPSLRRKLIPFIPHLQWANGDSQKTNASSKTIGVKPRGGPGTLWWVHHPQGGYYAWRHARAHFRKQK